MHIHRNILFLILLAHVLLGAPGTGATIRAEAAVDHGIFAELLNKYVKAEGVDYQGFKADEKRLDAYLGLLEKTDTARLGRAEQFAFYINAYNAWTIKLILSGYPGISSVWDLGGRFFDKPFQKKFIRLDGGTLSLDHIEHNILRPRFKDPRVHFAINCAARSCPPLRTEPYRGAALEAQLDEMTRAFINNPASNRLKGKTLYVSKIFKWFSNDFKNDVPGFVAQYATGKLKTKLKNESGRIRVKYLDYDWSLNGI